MRLIPNLSLPAVKSWLKKRFVELRKRPIIGCDFDRLRFVYLDLFNQNSEAYNLAGRPDFPINSDTHYPTTGEAFKDLCAKLEREVFLRLAYSNRKVNVPIRTQSISTRTNHSQEISFAGGQVTTLSFKSVGSETLEDVQIELSRKSAKAIWPDNCSEKVLRLFELFLSLRRNGVNPLGRTLRIPFDEFSTVYGYGQCYNQSYALADLLARNAIAVRLIHIHRPRHVLVEAEIEQDKWAAFDPQLSQAFFDRQHNTAFSFAQIQANLDTILRRFAVKDIEAAKSYYSAEKVTVEAFCDSNGKRVPRFRLEPGQQVEYSFAESYPWVHVRNLTPPPEGVLGHFKHFWGEGTQFRVTTPYPIIEAEVYISGEDTELSVEGVQAEYKPGWNIVRLSRYLKHQKTLCLTSSRPVSLKTISQLSALPYQRTGKIFVRVNAATDSPIKITVGYANCSLTPANIGTEYLSSSS